ncbi:MAG: L-threonylcarbamoyladenylate synthase [Parvicellaceae bacterium]|jgi:L-threonylcarbamoyladenylate synthase
MEEQIEKAIETLRNGGVILYPTDTIWGLGCDASNEEAVQKLYAIKKRSDSKSLIVLIDHHQKLGRYVKHIPDAAWDIIDHSAKPTTLILDGAYNMASGVIAEDGSIGIRVCSMEFCQKLIRRLNKPLVSTSANISGSKPAPNFQDISLEIKNQVDYIVDLPKYHKTSGNASSIIKLDQHANVTVIRK